MSDDYAKGAAAAAADFPHNKLASHAFKTLAKNAFGLVPGAANRLDEDRDGYTATHRAMQQDLHRTQNVSLSAGSASSTIPHSPANPHTHPESPVMNAADQIHLLEDLKNYLSMFQERLVGVSENYQRKVDALDGPLLTDIHELFVHGELEPARQMMAQLADLIVDSSIPAVERRIRQLEIILNND